jgi:NTE family protein
MTTALVLAGGGVAGIASETGVLRGLEEAAPQVAAALLDAEVIIGTSAGSTVAAQITAGRSLADLYDDQVNGTSPEIDIDFSIADLVERFGRAVQGAEPGQELRRRIGTLALETPTVEEAARRAVIEKRLPRHEWPATDLRIVAVDVATGEEAIFDRHSGVDLVDAVAASCAVPGVWPPVTIAGRRYMDGGVRSSSNVDLARGADRILVLSPAGEDMPSLTGVALQDEAAALAPAAVTVIYANAAALAAFGTNPLSTSTRRPGAEAGRAQGLEAAERFGDAW